MGGSGRPPCPPTLVTPRHSRGAPRSCARLGGVTARPTLGGAPAQPGRSSLTRYAPSGCGLQSGNEGRELKELASHLQQGGRHRIRAGRAQRVRAVAAHGGRPPAPHEDLEIGHRPPQLLAEVFRMGQASGRKSEGAQEWSRDRDDGPSSSSGHADRRGHRIGQRAGPATHARPRRGPPVQARRSPEARRDGSHRPGEVRPHR